MKITSLTRNSQFQYLYRRGESVVTPTMVVYVTKKKKGDLRLGITAGKKVGNAVLRNRAKRRIREQFRLCMPRLYPHADFCIVARTFTAQAPSEKVRRDFLFAMKKLGVLLDEEALG